MKYNRSEIMKAAWKMVKTAGMKISAALKAAWASAKAPLKQLHMKEWFANKVANEIRHNLHTTEIFAILRETEKAVYAVLAIEPGCTRCTWIPKSCIEEQPGSIDFHTRFGLSYEAAMTEARLFWSAYC